MENGQRINGKVYDANPGKGTSSKKDKIANCLVNVSGHMDEDGPAVS